MTEELREKLAHLPTGPGVYQHKDVQGAVLYVGKAKNLRSRVRSYFQEGRPREARIVALVKKITDVEVIVTDTEAEALILENNLIKSLKPRYNVNLKDDKTYPWICIKNERFPRIFPTRTLVRDGSKYFGPYSDVKSMHLVLDAVRSIFKLRTCALNLAPAPIAAGKYQVCLEYHIQKCGGPCVGHVSEASYNENIARIEKLLNGKTNELAGILKEDMQRLARERRFEDAAERRDQLGALETYAKKQKVVSAEDIDRDIFALAVRRDEDVACGVLFKVREGKLLGRQHHFLKPVDSRSEAELMQALLERYYTEAALFPEEVHISHEPEDREGIEAYLRAQKGRKVPIKVPERGDKAGLLRMTESNAHLLLDEWILARARADEGRIPHAVRQLQTDLRLPALPRRMECYDISHLSGTGTVASCVVFVDGQARKSDYRHYKIKSLEAGQIDDFASMREVLTRRYRKIVEENGPWPDLVVIDGGKGQLSSAVEALQQVEAYGKFPVIGLAKRLEEVFFPGDTESVLVPRTSASLHVLQRIRDEAHRFAVSFQREQRKSTLTTELVDIPGIGAKSAQKLLKAFGSVKKVREATEEELRASLGPKAARLVYAHFHAENPTPS